MSLSIPTTYGVQMVFPTPDNYSQVTWLDAAPGMVPVGAWARFVNGGMADLPVKIASFRASNLQGLPCVDIIIPDHPWMDAHGWGASHPDCPEGGSGGGRQVYAFQSYFPQAFVWAVSTQTAIDAFGTLRLNAERLEPPPPDLPSAFKDLETAWKEAHMDSALWSYGRSTACGGAACMNAVSGVACNGSFPLDHGFAITDTKGCHRFVALVVGGAPILAFNLTEGKAFKQKSGDNPTHFELDGGDYDNQAGANNNPVAGRGDNKLWLPFLLPLAAMGAVGATGGPLLWCTDSLFPNYTLGPFGAMLLTRNSDGVNISDRALNCSLWDELGLGSATALGAGAAGPPARPFVSALRPTLILVHPGIFTGLAGWERPIGEALEQGASVLASLASQRLHAYAALQVSLTDATTTLAGALMSSALLVVSVIAVACGRRDMEATFMRWGRRVLRRKANGNTALTVASKCLVNLIGATGIVLPLALGVISEQAARDNNSYTPKV